MKYLGKWKDVDRESIDPDKYYILYNNEVFSVFLAIGRINKEEEYISPMIFYMLLDIYPEENDSSLNIDDKSRMDAYESMIGSDEIFELTDFEVYGVISEIV